MSLKNGSSIFTKIQAKCPHCKGKIVFDIREAISDIPLTFLADSTRGRAELSILCITRGNDIALPFLKKMREHAIYLRAEFVIALDIVHGGLENFAKIQDLSSVVMAVKSKGYIESVLETALKGVSGQWVLRLDDDEEMSYALVKWLKSRMYLKHERWNIPTAALWPNKKYFITVPPLWPDAHLRLVGWDNLNWKDEVHAGGPARGEMAPVCILHHKFLLKNYEERRSIAENYDKLKRGAGTGIHQPFTLPEGCLDEIAVYPVGTGYFPRVGDVVGRGKRFDLSGKHL